ncbi:unnamed protein product [Didymodactylos carnosus]|uniref:NHL repeat-containing protein n=1 Tax=Didymodactylos carnosus TaxID=1234261 RepID=A0A814UJI2_9BILA|nr:unnamed protein product [Didymodactylos carnosus]CAF1176490.1 unnamed protein product [Didymodactylos carnosus]CAF3727562.1 unnamed protein product [Didymodactylos carnosus]CAF3940514.1 unnamed protein product [Didymodactylos carnosus]
MITTSSQRTTTVFNSYTTVIAVDDLTSLHTDLNTTTPTTLTIQSTAVIITTLLSTTTASTLSPSSPLPPLASQTTIATTGTITTTTTTLTTSSASECVSTIWNPYGQTVAGQQNGAGGSYLNQLSSPSDIFLDNNDNSVYVADYDNNRIVKWLANAFSGELLFSHSILPLALSVDRSNQNVFYSDSTTNSIHKWDKTTNLTSIVIRDGHFTKCYGLFINGEYLYVSDRGGQRVLRYTMENLTSALPTVVAGSGEQGVEDNELNFPEGIFVDKDGTVYVADKENNRIQKWTKGAMTGVTVAGGLRPGPGLKELRKPTSVVVDQRGNIFVADAGNSRIVLWAENALEGTLVVGNGHGPAPNQLKYPKGIWLDSQMNLYVSDRDNHRVQRYNNDKSGCSSELYLDVPSPSTAACVRYICKNLKEEYEQSIYAFNRCLMNENALNDKDVKQYQTSIDHAEHSANLRTVHLGNEVVHSSAFIQNLKDQLETMFSNLESKSIDDLSVKVSLDKIKLLSNSFTDIDSKYKKACELLAKKFDDLVDSFRHSVSNHEFNKCAEEITKLSQALSILGDHLKCTDMETKYSLLTKFFLDYLSNSAEKLNPVFKKEKLEDNDITNLNSCACMLESAKSTYTLQHIFL